MYDTTENIKGFHNSKVSLATAQQEAMKKRRNTNRTRLKDGLKANNKPKPIGSNSQGSYTMKTMVQDSSNDYDIDDGVYFDKAVLVGSLGGELTSLQVRQMVCEALGMTNSFKKAPEVLKNCVRVYYTEGYHVDVPAYRVISEKDTWTGNVNSYYELASSVWKRSDPLEVTNWFKAINKDLSPDSPSANGGQFRRIVRLLKYFSRSRPSWKDRITTGFMISKLAEECYQASTGRDDIALRETMKTIKNRLVMNSNIDHPVLQGERITNDNDSRPVFLKEKLLENLKHLEVLDNIDCSHEDAMKAWDKVLNCSWFSDQPGGNGNKSNKANKTPNAAVRKEGGNRYA